MKITVKQLWATFDAHGATLIKALGLQEFFNAYGPLARKWYVTSYKCGKEVK